VEANCFSKSLGATEQQVQTFPIAATPGNATPDIGIH
jgi:hypothetical protein